MTSDLSPPIAVASCPHRVLVDERVPAGPAVCSLLQQLSRVLDERLCQVGYDACVVCCQADPSTPEKINPVIASFLFQIGTAVIEAEGLPDCTVEEAIELKAWAFSHLKWAPGSKAMGRPLTCYASPSQYVRRGRTYACDVVLCCSDSSPQTEHALRSVLDQKSAVTLVHLVDNGGGGRELAERYAHCGTVAVHHNPVPKSPLATVHELVERLSSGFIAIQDARTVSEPYRISYSVGLLEEHGGDLLGAGLRAGARVIRPVEPTDRYDRYLPAETLVIRRASLVDLGGVADRPGDEDVELVYRAFQEKRSLLLTPEVTVSALAELSPLPLGPPPVYEPHNGILRQHARDFPMQRVACDVVLPVWGQLEHVRQGLEGLLAQEHADVVIHLVDDGSPENTDDFLRYWATHPQIRVYRNVCNLSQFTSFNNVSRYFETDLVAVQDGDDVSLPHRIHLAGNTLRLAGADIFGSAVVIFDGGAPMSDEGWDRLLPDIRVRRWKNLGISAWPTPGVFWFVFNPSMVLRTDVFRTLGGFGDFGGAVRNRCGHDIEFCLRAYHHGKRFALSRQPTVLYRQHPGQTTRSPVTGFGTDAEGWTSQEARRRGDLYRRTRFDPVAFGALGKYQDLTQRFVP